MSYLTKKYILCAHKNRKCVVCGENRRQYIFPQPMFREGLALWDVRNYVPLCKKHEYFNVFKYMKTNYPSIYFDMRYLSDIKTRWGDGNIYGRDMAIRFWKNKQEFEQYYADRHHEKEKN